MLSKIVLKKTSDNYYVYEYNEALSLYNDYCNNYMDLRVFCMDNFLTLESGEILIKTIRKNITLDMKKHLKSIKR